MTRWVYTERRYDFPLGKTNVLISALDDMGNLGWEAWSMTGTVISNHEYVLVMFKKPK